jgi:glutathione peroxidase
MAAALYDIPVKSIDGKDTSLGQYKGSVLLVVNVASACGLTPQYSDQGFKVLGFPANDFGAQEPGTNEEIKSFCETKFDVKFPMFAKISVKGAAQHPLYHQLIAEKPTADGDKDSGLRTTLAKHGLGPTNDTDVMWNFEKFLVGRDGKVVGRFAPDITPDDPKITAAIEGALAKH